MMNNTATTPQLIEKEIVDTLNFVDVEKSTEETKELIRRLRKATVLGNIEHNKIRIIFRDSEGVKEVHTTIWATTESNIVLKQGRIIPIKSIIKIIF